MFFLRWQKKYVSLLSPKEIDEAVKFNPVSGACQLQ